MTFPMEDQYIPPEFRDTIDVGMTPEPVDQDEVERLEERRADARRLLRAYNSQVDHLENLQSHDPERAAYRRFLKNSLRRYRGLRGDMKDIIADTGADLDFEQGDWAERLTGPDRDAFEALSRMFAGFGLGSLAPKIFEYVKEGYGADTIALLLQDTKEYKERFAANEARRKKGLAVLSPQEYLQVEAAYRQILESSGMPKGFYDNPADFQNWIASDVAPAEIKERVDLAVQATTQANPAYREALMEMYGIDTGGMAAYFLDRSKAEPILKKQAAAAAVGAAALRRGLRVDRGRMEDLATSGISGEEAARGYAEIERGLSSMLGIARRFGSSWSLEEAEDATFGLGGEAKRRGLASRERALFAGSRGSSAMGLSSGYRQT